MLTAMPNEEVIITTSGRWLYCHDDEDGWTGYLHLECDLIADESGHCIGCGAASPAAYEKYVMRQAARNKQLN